MRALVVMTKANGIFAGSFLEAAEEKNISLETFCLDERQECPLSYWREALKQMIREKNIKKVLMLNDLSSGTECLADESIFTMVSCNVWFVDPLQRNAYVTADHLKRYGRIFSYEPTDIPYCKGKFGIAAQYIPFPAGKTLFCSNPRDFSEKEEFAVSFVGLAAGNEKRLQVLEAAARVCQERHYTMALYGNFWRDSHWLQSTVEAFKFRKKYPALYPFVHNYKLAPEEVSALYRKSKINLNIHYADIRRGASPRTFEILGNNNFELCDDQDFSCTGLVPGQHLAVYHDLDELKEQLVYYLEHDGERIRIAKNGGQIVREQYMFEHVIEKVLE